MSEPFIPNLGAIPDANARRDAVHVAVAPVVASERLVPGQHVGILEDGRAGPGVKAAGIVDPYLTNAIESGQRFWLFLYPGTVTSLRHVWTHPDFKVRAPIESR